MKSIHWLVPHNVKEPKDISRSNLASIRLRTSLFNLPIFSEYKITINESIDEINNIDYLFISKFPSKREDLITKWLELIENHRKNGRKIFFDYTDHHLIRETLASQFYRTALKSNDQIITSSEKLKNHLSLNFENITIIEDPIEIEIQKVKKNKGSSFLFFGHQTNLKYLSI